MSSFEKPSISCFLLTAISVNFSVFGNDTEAARFGELLKDAAQSIHDILDETRSQQV